MTLCVHRPGHKRRGGGCIKPTWYVYRAVRRAPEGVSGSSGLWRRAWGVNPAPEVGLLAFLGDSSTCIAKGTTRRGGGCFEPTGMCTGWFPGPRQVFQMPRVFVGGRGHEASIQHRKRGNRPFLGPFDPLGASPRAQMTGRWLHKTDLVHVQSGPQGPDRCFRWLGSPAVGAVRRFSNGGWVIGLCMATLEPLRASPRAQHDGAAASSNRPGMFTGWFPRPRQVCQMPRVVGGGGGASIQH